MKTNINHSAIILVAAAVLFISTVAFAKEIISQTECPVTGEKINKELYVDADGKRVYACCEGCIIKVEANPGDYIEQLEKQQIVLDKTQVAQTEGTVTGKKINHKHDAELRKQDTNPVNVSAKELYNSVYP